MSIIPKNTPAVNRKTAEKERSKSIQKWQQKKLNAQIMAGVMEKRPKLQRRAERMKHCGEMVLFRWCPKCGHTHGIAGGMCRDRLCPLCEWRLSLTKYSQMMQVFDLLHNEFTSNGMFASMLTLTVKNVRIGQLAETLRRFTDAWRAVTRRVCMKGVKGWARNIEITRNAEDGTYHPHVHILLLWQELPDKPLGQIALEIVKEWRRQMDISYQSVWHHEIAYEKPRDIVDYVQDHKTAAQAAAAEAAMYTLSSDTILNIPDSEIEEFAAAIAGTRMTGYGGIIKKARKLLGLKEDEIEADAEAAVDKCPVCGERMQAYVLEWCAGNGVYAAVDKPFDKGGRW